MAYFAVMLLVAFSTVSLLEAMKVFAGLMLVSLMVYMTQVRWQVPVEVLD